MRFAGCGMSERRFGEYDAADLQFTTFSSALARFITVGEFVQGVQGAEKLMQP